MSLGTIWGLGRGCHWDRLATGRYKFIQCRERVVRPVALIVLLDASAFGAVALLLLCLPRRIGLLSDNRVIPAIIIAQDEAVHRALAVLFERLGITAKTAQPRQHHVVIGQAGGGDLVPRRGP